MPIKAITVISLIQTAIFTTIFIAGAVILSNETEYKKEAIYKWSIFMVVTAAISGIISILSTCMNSDVNEMTQEEKITRVSMSWFLLLLDIALVIWGSIIYFNLTENEKKLYNNDIYDLWLFFEITFIYMFASMVLLGTILTCICFCSCCAVCVIVSTD